GAGRRGAGVGGGRRYGGDRGGRGGLVATTICPFDAHTLSHLLEFVEKELPSKLTEVGATVLATLVTEPTENNYPRLAIREGESVLVLFARFADRESHRLHVGELERWPEWRMAAP